MSTQNISATVGNKMMARTFVDSATDGKWDGNLLLSQNSSQNIGLEMTGVTVDFCQVQYTGGACLWRFRDSVTNAIMRWGFGSKVGYVCGKENYIPPFKILPTLCLKYILCVDATATILPIGYYWNQCSTIWSYYECR